MKPTNEQLDDAAKNAARKLRRLGAVGLETRRYQSPEHGQVYEIRCRVQRGRVAARYESGLHSNVVAAAYGLIAAIEADASGGGRRPKPEHVTPGVEPMFGLPDVTALLLQQRGGGS